MKEIYSNINIIGGGMVGTILAYSLSQHDIEITILEKKSTFKPSKHTDKRTTAISEGTKNFLDKIFLWSEIKKYCEPIKKIKVINRKKSNQIVFDNQRRKSNLGYIVKNSDLLKVLYTKLRKRKNIKILNNIDIIDFQNEKEKIITKCKNIKIYSNLNIAADGKKSFVKKFYKTNFYSKDYNKKAMVLTFTHSKNHNGAAFEFFYKNGPLAILPMKKYKNDFVAH